MPRRPESGFFHIRSNARSIWLKTPMAVISKAARGDRSAECGAVADLPENVPHMLGHNRRSVARDKIQKLLLGALRAAGESQGKAQRRNQQ